MKYRLQLFELRIFEHHIGVVIGYGVDPADGAEGFAMLFRDRDIQIYATKEVEADLSKSFNQSSSNPLKATEATNAGTLGYSFIIGYS